MLTKSIVKIWLLSVNFDELTSITVCGDESHPFERSTVIGRGELRRFSKLTDSNQILKIDFVSIHCHLCEILSQII